MYQNKDKAFSAPQMLLCCCLLIINIFLWTQDSNPAMAAPLRDRCFSTTMWDTWILLMHWWQILYLVSFISTMLISTLMVMGFTTINDSPEQSELSKKLGKGKGNKDSSVKNRSGWRRQGANLMVHSTITTTTTTKTPKYIDFWSHILI